MLEIRNNEIGWHSTYNGPKRTLDAEENRKTLEELSGKGRTPGRQTINRNRIRLSGRSKCKCFRGKHLCASKHRKVYCKQQIRSSQQIAKRKDNAIAPKARGTVSRENRNMERRRCRTTIKTRCNPLRGKTASNPSTTKKRVQEVIRQAILRRDSNETTTTRSREI